MTEREAGLPGTVHGGATAPADHPPETRLPGPRRPGPPRHRAADAADRAGSTSTVDRALSGLFGRDALYMGLWAAQIFGAALVTPLVTRLMPQDQFGTLATANAVMQVLSVLAGIGLSTAIQRSYATGGAAAARKLLTVAAAGSLAVATLFYLTGPLWSRALGFADFTPVLKLVVVWGATGALTNCALALIRSQDRLLRFGVVSLLQSVVAEAASLLLVAGGTGSGAQLFVVGQVVAQFLAMSTALVLAAPLLPRRADRPLVASAFRFGLPLVPSALSTFVLSVADRLVLQSSLGAAPVGAYQLAYNVGSAPMLLLGVLSTAWLPRLFGLGSDKAHILATSRTAIYRLLPAIVLGMAAGGPVLLRLWAPASYHPDDLRLTLMLIVLSAVPYAGGLAATRTLLVSGRTGAVATGNILAAVLNLALNFVLVPHLQLVGSALATLLAYTALWIALLVQSHRVLPIASSPRGLTVTLLVACGLALAAAALPVGGGFLVGRLLLAAVALGWLLHIIRGIRRGTGTPPSRTPTAPLQVSTDRR